MLHLHMPIQHQTELFFQEGQSVALLLIQESIQSLRLQQRKSHNSRHKKQLVAIFFASTTRVAQEKGSIHPNPTSSSN
jgi:hypothetical protein